MRQYIDSYIAAVYCSRMASSKRLVDFGVGGEDVLALAQARLARDQCFGRIVTQALLCRAGLRMLATAPSVEVERAVRAQLRVELRNRLGVELIDPGPDDPGPDDGEELSGVA